MELTPIKVRGKHRRGDEPVKASPEKKPGAGSKAKPRRPRESKASNLLRIPLEILEQIFWYSGNINLPRCHPLLGRLLSGRYTVRETFIAAFQPTWDAHFGVVADNTSSQPTKGDPTFQSEILEYKWANISFILECWDIYIQRVAKARAARGAPSHLRHVRIWGDPDNVGNILAKDNSFLVDLEHASHCFHHDLAAFSRIGERIPGYLMLDFMAPPPHLTLQQVHKDTRIPDSLFASPGDEEALQKLFWLVRGGARLAPDQTWELTQQTFRDAVPDSRRPDADNINIVMFRILDVLGAFDTWPEHVVDEEGRRILAIMDRAHDRDSIRETGVYSYILQTIGFDELEGFLPPPPAPGW